MIAMDLPAKMGYFGEFEYFGGKNVFKKMRVVLFDPIKTVQAENNLSAEGSLSLRK